jgi:hypothetical protein
MSVYFTSNVCQLVCFFFLLVCKELCWSDPDATRQRIHCPKQIHKKRGAYTHPTVQYLVYVQLDYYYSLLSLYVHPLGEQPTELKNVSKKEELLLGDSRLPSVCPENITHTVCIIMIFRMDIYTYWKKKETESRVSIREHLSYIYIYAASLWISNTSLMNFFSHFTSGPSSPFSFFKCICHLPRWSLVTVYRRCGSL